MNIWLAWLFGVALGTTLPWFAGKIRVALLTRKVERDPGGLS